MPIERDSFSHHPGRMLGRIIVTLVIVVGLAVGAYVAYEYRQASNNDTKPVDNSESRAELDKLYGGADSPKSDLSQLEVVKSELTKMQFTLANGWKSTKTQDKAKGTEKIVASSPDATKKIDFILGYPQLGGACDPNTVGTYEVISLEKIATESSNAVDGGVIYLAGLSCGLTGKDSATLSVGLVSSKAIATKPNLKAGDKLKWCEGAQIYNVLNTKYLSPRDIITDGEYVSIIAGNATQQSNGYEFASLESAREYIAGDEFQQVVQILTSVQLNL